MAAASHGGLLTLTIDVGGEAKSSLQCSPMMENRHALSASDSVSEITVRGDSFSPRAFTERRATRKEKHLSCRWQR